MILSTLLMVGLAPLSSFAQDKNYSFVEAGYQYTDVNGPLSPYVGHGDGGYVKGSYDFDQSAYVFGTASRVSGDVLSHNLKLDTYDVGLGYHYPLNQQFDLLTEAAWYRESVKDYDHADGYRLAVGSRANFGQHWDAQIKANYINGQDFVPGWTVSSGVQYKINPQWSVQGEAEYFDKSYTAIYRLGARYSF